LNAKIALVVVVAENGVIGAKGGMPWRLSTDLKRFKAITLGKPVIMGRKTFEAIGKALVQRTNIVVTRDREFRADDVVVAHSVDEALRLGQEIAIRDNVEEICVIGGGQVYAETMAIADRIYLTRANLAPEGDTFFPQIDADRWREVVRQDYPAGEKDDAPTTYLVYERRR
jgi:dihydrofolate reductase